jgi:hypothetical protein
MLKYDPLLDYDNGYGYDGFFMDKFEQSTHILLDMIKIEM